MTTTPPVSTFHETSRIISSRVWLRLFRLAAAALAVALPWRAALSQEEQIGVPYDWQLGFQPISSPVMRNISTTNDLLLGFMILVVLLVFGLIVYILLRFNEKANPEPSTVTHNTMLEVVWTGIPSVCLIILGFLTLPYIVIDSRIPKADVVIKVAGHQWYWSFEYPEEDGLTFDSIMAAQTHEEAGDGVIRLLSVDNEVVVPVNSVVEMDITSNDVLHSFALPALGVKMDAVPGRVNKTWFLAEKEGWYYGQCSELCGGRHAFMPVAVRVVSASEYRNWLVEAKEEFASLTPRQVPSGDGRAVQVARNVAVGKGYGAVN